MWALPPWLKAPLGGLLKGISGEVTRSSHSLEWQSTDQSWILKNLEETIALGKELGKKIPNLNLLLLYGPLGAGKTSLIKGLGMSLGITEPISSPTFSLAQHYPPGKPPLIHLDLYRLENTDTANELFLQEEEEAIAVGAVMAIEWPERLGILLPEAWKLKLEYRTVEGRLATLTPPH